MYDFIKKVSAKELKGVSPGFIQGEIHFVPQFQFSTARPGFGLTTTPARVKTRTDPFTALVKATPMPRQVNGKNKKRMPQAGKQKAASINVKKHLPMNLVASASRRRVGGASRPAKETGSETPPELAAGDGCATLRRFRGSKREIPFGRILTPALSPARRGRT